MQAVRSRQATGEEFKATEAHGVGHLTVLIYVIWKLNDAYERTFFSTQKSYVVNKDYTIFHVAGFNCPVEVEASTNNFLHPRSFST